MSSDEIKLILEKLAKLDEIELRQRSMETGIINLGTRLEALENLVEQRLQDTRPMWQGVQAQVSELREEMRQGFEQVGKEMKLLNKKVERIHNDVLGVQAEQGLLESDVEDLKKKVS
jgi:hypothetical protein